MPATTGIETMTVVIIDDNDEHLRLLTRSVESAFENDARSVTVERHTSPDQALAELPAHGPTVILLDYQLGGATGIDWLPDFIREDVGPVIVITSSGDERIAAEAFRLGASDYIVKSTVIESPERIRASIVESQRRYRLEMTNRDLSRRLKVANAELERKNSKLAELTETAHRFVDDVAHEFRTPLAVIKEFASIIADGIGGDVTDKQTEYLQFILDSSRDLAHLVDDFLDSGKLRARTLRVERCHHGVGALIDSTWAMLESRAASRHVQLARRVESDLPSVYGDADKVRRTLINLVVNAIKFSKPDDVVTISADRDDGGCVRIGVTDRGPGLPEEERQQLFERFRQGGEGTRISSKGFGLGLNIVRELVAINLGEVSVTSTLGEGSTFSFTLPGSGVPQIVSAFAQRTQERSPRGLVSVLCVRRAGASGTEELQSFLASVCHPTDIQLPLPRQNAILIAGETAEPDGWRDRLIRQDEENRRHAPADSAGSLVIEQIGTWTVREVRDALLDLTCPSKETERCA